MIVFTANGRCAKIKADEPITTGSVGMPVSVVLSGDFDGLAATMVFACGDVSADVALMGQEVAVPPQVLEEAGRVLEIGVYGALADGTIVIPTVWAKAGIVNEGVLPSGVDPAEPTPSWAAQVQQWAEDAHNTAEDAHDTAEQLAQDVASWEAEIDAAIENARYATQDATQTAASIAQAEFSRVTAESSRATAETARVTAEAARATAESSRVAAESSRVTAEQARTTAESSRAEAETGRSTAESARATAETARRTAESARATEWAEIEPAAQSATQSATVAAALATRAADAATAVVAAASNGNVPYGTLTGTVLTADDAWSAFAKSVGVHGKSTQAGTPTPSSPVSILSVDALTLHASADGTTDYGNWPVQIPLSDHSLRSLPDGTEDELTLSYVGPSTEHEGWGVYSKTLVQKVGSVTFDGTERWTSATTIYAFLAYASPDAKWSDALNVRNVSNLWSNRFVGSTNNNQPGLIRLDMLYPNISFEIGTFSSTAEVKAWLAANPTTMYYPLATPVTHDLGTVELTILPNPLTAWADGGSAQPTMQLEYERALSIVIPRIEAAISDLATS